jgi:CheY-like chemotaxis protein
MALELNSGRIGDDANSPPGSIEGASKTILVVDDEMPILTVTGIMLRARGYRVMKASSVQEALEFLRGGQGNVDLVITDINMPGRNGVDLIQQIRSCQPVPKVIASSGNEEFEQAESLASLGVSALLIKPFTKGMLLEAVHCAMDESQSAYRVLRR